METYRVMSMDTGEVIETGLTHEQACEKASEEGIFSAYIEKEEN